MNIKKKLAQVPLPSGSHWFCSIDQIPSFGKDLFDSGLRLDVSKDIYFPSDDEDESALRANSTSLVPYPQRYLRTRQGAKGGVSVLNVDVVIKEVDKNAAQVFGLAILDKLSCTPFVGFFLLNVILLVLMPSLFKKVSMSLL